MKECPPSPVSCVEWTADIVEDWTIKPAGNKDAIFNFQAPNQKGQIHLVCSEKKKQKQAPINYALTLIHSNRLNSKVKEKDELQHPTVLFA